MLKLLTAIMLCCLYASYVHASSNVLLLNSYHPQYKWTDELTRGVQASLARGIPSERLHIEYMDARRFIDDPVYEKKFTDILKYKYQHNKPSVVITSDDAAYQLMLKRGQELFPDVPTVFSGVNVFDPNDSQLRSNITGVVEGMDVSGNLKLITYLQPNIERIVVLGDTTGFGLQLVNVAKEIRALWQLEPEKSAIQIDIWDSFLLEELYVKASQLPQNTAILILAIHKDMAGHYFAYEEHVQELSRHSSVPIYGMWGAPLMGNGVVGGMMNDAYEHGFKAGEIALKVIAGEPFKLLPVKSAVELDEFKPRFDFNQLQRFGIEPHALPANSTVYYQPQSFYQKNRVFVNTVFAVFVVLILLITFLVWNIQKRIVIQQKLKLFNEKLDITVKERTSALNKTNEELRVVSETMKKLAHTDSLTGLNNRRSAEKKITAYINRYNISQMPLALAILDIDHFKRVNDNFGHLIGDQVLQALAKVLIDSLRPSDSVYRWGGEEFLIALPDAEAEQVASILSRLMANIRNIRIDEVGIITVSIGVTHFEPEDNFSAMVKRADDALYQAKGAGRDTLVLA